MKFGKRTFSVLDMIGDLVMHAWETRKAGALEDFTRKTLKLAVLALVAIAMTQVLYPTQKRGWELWLGPKEEALAHWTAVVLVGFSALILTLVRTSWTHGHKILASASGMFMACLMVVVLGGTWNYYAATSNKAVGAATAALTGSTDRVKEAQTALAELDTSQKASLSGIDAAIANAPANRLNGRAALLRQRTAIEATGRAERLRIETELRAARTASVTTQTNEFDPRPIDGVMAQWFHADRNFMGSINDLIRSLNFEFIAILGVALGTTVALSHIGEAGFEARPSGLAIEDLREARLLNEDGTQREAEPMKPPAKGERVWDEDTQAWMIKRRGSKDHYARVPTKKANRKTRDLKGKLSDDQTEYEAPAKTVASDPRVHGDAAWEAETDVAQQDLFDEDEPAIVVEEPISEAAQTADADGRGSGGDSASERGEMAGSDGDEGGSVAENAEEPAPVELDEEAAQHGIDHDYIDPESGEIYSQEHVQVIRQDADERMADERGLPAPAKILESAK